MIRTFDRTTSLSLHTFCHMMEMGGWWMVIFWTRVMHPVSDHLLPVDMMCEILTEEWNSTFSWEDQHRSRLCPWRRSYSWKQFVRRNDTTRKHNMNNNFIFTLGPNHRTEPPNNQREDGRRCRTSRGRWRREQQTKVSERAEGLQEDDEVGWVVHSYNNNCAFILKMWPDVAH